MNAFSHLRTRALQIAVLITLAALAAIAIAIGSQTQTARADRAASISSGDHHTCAAKEDGSAWCWGSNGFGQVGVGEIGGPEICTNVFIRVPAGANDEYPCSTEPMQVSGLGSGVQKVAAGSDFACALKDSGGVSCWGRNDIGQLGSGELGPQTCTDAITDAECSTTPVDVSGITDAVGIAAGAAHACALLANGGVQCWGSNRFGAVGLGDVNGPDDCGGFDCALTPADVEDLKTSVSAAGANGVEITQISAGGANTCALYSDGTAQCWGWGRAGRLGDGTADDGSYGATDVTGLNDAVQLSSGAAHTCALLDDGTVECWGENSRGQLGVGLDVSPDPCGFFDCATAPNPVPGLSGISAISSGGPSSRHICAINSAVMCWGLNVSGQLGTGDRIGPEQCGGNDCSATPVEATTVPDVQTIVAGSQHSCAMTPLHGIICWGRNFQGETGSGTCCTNFFYALEPVTALDFEGGTPTPSPVPPNARTWADLNCSGSVDPVDSLFVLRGDAGLPTNTGECPDIGAAIEVVDASPHIWGDIDCNGAMNPIDSLKLLRHDAGLSVSQEAGCPEIGEQVLIEES